MFHCAMGVEDWNNKDNKTSVTAIGRERDANVNIYAGSQIAIDR